MKRIFFQYRWYEIARGESWHYIDVALNSCLNAMWAFARRHNWQFRFTITSTSSVIIHRVR